MGKHGTNVTTGDITNGSHAGELAIRRCERWADVGFRFRFDERANHRPSGDKVSGINNLILTGVMTNLLVVG